MKHILWTALKPMGVAAAAAALTLPRIAAAGGELSLAWLSDLGAEAHAVNPRPLAWPGLLWINVPGAALAFSVEANGALVKRARLATDFSSANGLAAARGGAVVAQRDGAVSLWREPSGPGAPELVWRRALASRATSVSWSGGEKVWITTRDSSLVALASADGAVLWTLPLGGRADAPAAGTDRDVYVATKAKTLLRIDGRTGTIRWRAPLAGPALHPPLVVDGEHPVVVCGTWNGTLAAFAAGSGNALWSVELPAKLAGAPVFAAGRVAAVTEDGSVHAYERGGAPAWSAADVAQGPASLAPLTGADGEPRLLVASRTLALLDWEGGATHASYPEGARRELQQRFVRAMMEGERTWTEAEKRAAEETEAFALQGPLFAPAQTRGAGLALASEDGWVYLFEAARLRPVFRYRAGQAALSLPEVAGGRLLAAGGDEVFALAPRTGRLLWRRGLGGTVRELAAGDAVAVLAAERLTALDGGDGARHWTQTSDARFVSSQDGSWIVAGERGLRVLDAAGTERARLALGGEALRPVALGGGRLAAATREGRVLGLAWRAAPAQLETLWERPLGAGIRELLAAPERLLVRLDSGELLGLDAHGGRELWRIALAPHEHVRVAGDARALVAYGGDTVRVYGLDRGEITFAREARAEAVGVDLAGGRLRWLDRAGRAHAADLASGRLETGRALGVALEAAAPAAGGFVVKTAAGEIGLLLADEASGPAAPLD